MELSMIYQAPRAHFVLIPRLHKATKTSRAHLVAGARCHLREYSPKAVSATHKKDCTNYDFFFKFLSKKMSQIHNYNTQKQGGISHRRPGHSYTKTHGTAKRGRVLVETTFFVPLKNVSPFLGEPSY